MEAIVLVKDNKIIDINQSALDLFDIKSKDKMLGKNIYEFIDKESRDILKNIKEQEVCEISLIKDDNITIPVLLKEILFDKQESITLITALDLTEIKQKDKLLIHSAKMAQMGEMIENIAHQWRQPLSVITTAATAIKMKKDFNVLDNEDIDNYTESITKNANYLSNTIDTFRNFIKEKVELKEVVIQDRIKKVLDIIKPRLENKYITLIDKIDYTKPICAVIVIGELSQVIMNILNNSVDILVEKNIDEKWIILELQENEKFAVISIEDNGGGVPYEIMSKIFEPYFTTKHQSIGTGIGLYMSYDIIVNHMKGNLYVKNTKNGAKFFIEIPKVV
jgi:signal transduction histidine kinase